MHVRIKGWLCAPVGFGWLTDWPEEGFEEVGGCYGLRAVTKGSGRLGSCLLDLCLLLCGRNARDARPEVVSRLVLQICGV
jgi:hypothetical protein